MYIQINSLDVDNSIRNLHYTLSDKISSGNVYIDGIPRGRIASYFQL